MQKKMTHYLGQNFNGTEIIGEIGDNWICQRTLEEGGFIHSIEGNKIYCLDNPEVEKYNQPHFASLLVWERKDGLYISSSYYSQFHKFVQKIEKMPEVGKEIHYSQVVEWELPKGLRTAKSFSEMLHAGEDFDDSEDSDNTPYHKGDELAY